MKVKSPILRGGLVDHVSVCPNEAGSERSTLRTRIISWCRPTSRPATQLFPDWWKKMIKVYDAFLAPVDR
jgi:hypothetical protein